MDLSSNIDDRSEGPSSNFIEKKMRKVERMRPGKIQRQVFFGEKKKERSKTPQPVEILEIDTME